MCLWELLSSLILSGEAAAARGPVDLEHTAEKWQESLSPSLRHKEDHQLFSGPHIWCGTCAHTICSHLPAAIMTFNILSLCMRHILRKGGGRLQVPQWCLACLFAFPFLWPVCLSCSCISTWQQKLYDQWKHSQFWPYSDWLKWCSLRNCVNQPKGLIVNHDSYCNQPGPLLSVVRFILFLSLWRKKNNLNFFFCLAQLCLAVETATGGVEGGSKACSHFVINLSQKSCIQNTFLNSALSILL